jgi:hypothetical protein
MADDVAPYSKAIEETAKTAGKALDIVRDGAHAISRPVANIYGLLIGDQIEAARERNLDAISRKIKKILAERDLSETSPVAEQIAIPLLEAARGETREEMQDLWAQLLANAMDPARRDDVRTEFIQTLERFHPIDALVLRTLGNGNSMFAGALANELQLRQSTVVVSLNNLELYHCVEVRRSPDPYVDASFKISNFGSEMLLALS